MKVQMNLLDDKRNLGFVQASKNVVEYEEFMESKGLK